MISFRAVLLLALLLAVSVGAASEAGAQEAPPNILLIVTDDQRATNTLGVMPKTRRYFQRGGRRFTRAFATTPLCCPSRTTILTGRYAHNTGVRQNRARGIEWSTLFPRLLARAGYQTAMTGKFLNSWGPRRKPPHFQHWATLNLGRGLYVDPTFNVDGRVRREAGYSTNLIGRHATDFLRLFEQQDDAPWFLYVAPTAPHLPWTPAAKYARASVPGWGGNPAVFERDRSDKPAYVRNLEYTRAQAERVRVGQLRALMSADDMVGRIVSKLQDLGEKRDTLAIFTSDNGYMWADHRFGGDVDSAGEKRAPYSASVRVPFLLRWPGIVAAGSTDGRIVGNVDIAPTVLSAAAVAPDPDKPPLDGRSLLSPGGRARILLEYWKEAGQPIPTWASVRTKRYQYVEYYRGSRRIFREYYNLKNDPWQLRNLLADAKRKNDPDVGMLRALLARDRKCIGTGPGACP